MNKMFSFEILESNPLPYLLLSNDVAISQLEERQKFKDAILYFITKVKKVRFDLQSLHVNGNVINIILIVRDKRIECKFTLYDCKCIDVLDSSTSKLLKIKIDGTTNSDPYLMTPDMFLRGSKGVIDNKPEIIYIGYSFDPINRLRSHEKIVKAYTDLEDDEELRLYINSFKFSCSEILPNKQVAICDNIGIEKGRVSDETLKNYIKLVERIFIHYFQTESLNDHHINMDIMKDPKLDELLRQNGFRFFGGGFDMNGGEYFDFWSTYRKNQVKTFCFDFENPDKGYITLEEALQLFFD